MEKINEKDEIFKKIEKIADDLRGKVSGWDFKSYVLCGLFFRYLSENISNRINKQARDAGDYEFNYPDLSDEELRNLDGFS